MPIQRLAVDTEARDKLNKLLLRINNIETVIRQNKAPLDIKSSKPHLNRSTLKSSIKASSFQQGTPKTHRKFSNASSDKKKKQLQQKGSKLLNAVLDQ